MFPSHRRCNRKMSLQEIRQRGAPRIRAPRIAVILVGLLIIVPFLPTAAAQGNSQWHGQDNEFGSIRMKFQDAIVGEPIEVEAHITLKTLYEDKRVTYFMFAFTAEGQPLCVNWDYIGTEGGDGFSFFKEEGSNGDPVIKKFVEDTQMPPPGQKIVLKGTVGAADRGLMQVGALIVPFNYKWEKVTMKNGLPADLFSFTQFGVNKETPGCSATGSSGGGSLVGNLRENLTPAPGAALVATAVAIAAGIVVWRRRTEP